MTEDDIDRAVRAFCADPDRFNPVGVTRQQPVLARRPGLFYS
ncbi:hypothetical protein [Nocardiopsis baichengensis]|nr:hypothetical protein [Nocardiopsis baichengensis]